MDKKTFLIELLKAEVKPALGCTEPGAVALACAKAKDLLDSEQIISCDIFVSPNIYKNGMGVGIPGSNGEVGLSIAAALGLAGGDANSGLNALESTTKEDLEKAKDMVKNNIINIIPKETKDSILVEVIAKSNNHESEVKIVGKHDNIVVIKKDNVVVFESEEVLSNQTESRQMQISDLEIKEIVETVQEIEFSEIKFLLDGIKMNDEIASKGLQEKLGAGVGFAYKQAIETGIIEKGLMSETIMMTAAASDARMSGIKMPVMSSNGSGNHGLTAIIPIAVYNKYYPQTEEKLAKALAISHLVVAYVKAYTGRLSAVCGCGVAASVGSSAGITWLMGLGVEGIEGAINSMVADLSGIICDGAKPGCAYKLASAASASLQGALMAKFDSTCKELNGIVGKTARQSVENLGRVAKEGMTETDKVIVKVMDDMNRVR